MKYKRIVKPSHIRKRQGPKGGHTSTLGDAIPYMLEKGSCVFDSRHFVYDTLDGCFPFPVTTRINDSHQIFLLKTYGDPIKF